MMPEQEPIRLLAEAYAAIGLRVFPVDMRPDENGHPRKTPFHGYLWKERATADPDRALADFRQAEQVVGPGELGNIGIGWALGLDGYLALDLDGQAPLWWQGLPDTLVNVTAKGEHLIYRAPGGRIVSNSTAKFPDRDWGDLRGAGGYIVIAGPDREGLTGGLGEVADFPHPEWLTDAGDSAAAVSRPAAAEWIAGHSGGEPGGSAAKIKGYETALAAWRPGVSRHQTAVDVACWIAREAAAGLVDAQAAFLVLKRWWGEVAGADSRKLSGWELESVIRYAVGNATVDPQRVETIRERDAARQPPDPAGQPTVVDGLSVDEFARIDWHELYADQTPLVWVVPLLLPVQRHVSLYSTAGVGKSLLSLEIAVCVSRGTEILGQVPDRPRRVLYVDFENDPRGDILQRLKSMYVWADDLDGLDFLSYPDLTDLDTQAGGLRLLRAVQRWSSELVVIDTVSRAVSGEENSNDTWLGFYRHTGLPLKQAKVSLLRLDHSGKDSGKGQRGGSAKSGDVDAVWRLTDNGGNRLTLECEKHRFEVPSPRIELRRDTVPLLRHVVLGGGLLSAWDQRVAETVGWLDALGVPDSAGRPSAASLLKADGKVVDTNVLADAVRVRKGRIAPLSGVPDSSILKPLSGRSSDSPRQLPLPDTSDPADTGG